MRWAVAQGYRKDNPAGEAIGAWSRTRTRRRLTRTRIGTNPLVPGRG